MGDISTFSNVPAGVLDRRSYSVDWTAIDAMIDNTPGPLIDRLIDDEVNLFNSVPSPSPAVIGAARKLSRRYPQPRYTKLSVNSLAISAALLKLKPRLTATQLRVLSALGRAVPENVLYPEQAV